MESAKVPSVNAMLATTGDALTTTDDNGDHEVTSSDDSSALVTLNSACTDAFNMHR